MTFDMIGRIEPCALVVYRASAGCLQSLLPRGLELITHDRFGFLGIVISRLVKMRPRGFPSFVGVSYAHIAYRLYVRARLADGRIIDGIHFLRSDVDSRLMSLGGNLMTDFCFHPSQITLRACEEQLDLTIKSPDGIADAELSLASERCAPTLASGSCFASIGDAEDVLKYRPLGLSCDASGSTLKIAQVLRDESKWIEMPARVEHARWSYLDRVGCEFHLERATRVAPIDYRWRLGLRERIAASSSR